jgi:hypothetical protein
LESYFDITMAVLLGLFAFLDVDMSEWGLFVDSSDNVFSTVITLIILISILVFPVWSYFEIMKMVRESE